MLQYPVGHIIENDISYYQIVRNSPHLVFFNNNVRCYASTFTHLTTGFCIENMRKAVGYARHTAIGIAMRIIDGLDASSTGNVIFGGCKLDAATVRKTTGSLHQSFAERTISDDNGSI